MMTASTRRCWNIRSRLSSRSLRSSVMVEQERIAASCGAASSAALTIAAEAGNRDVARRERHRARVPSRMLCATRSGSYLSFFDGLEDAAAHVLADRFVSVEHPRTPSRWLRLAAMRNIADRWDCRPFVPPPERYAAHHIAWRSAASSRAARRRSGDHNDLAEEVSGFHHRFSLARVWTTRKLADLGALDLAFRHVDHAAATRPPWCIRWNRRS